MAAQPGRIVATVPIGEPYPRGDAKSGVPQRLDYRGFAFREIAHRALQRRLHRSHHVVVRHHTLAADIGHATDCRQRDQQAKHAAQHGPEQVGTGVAEHRPLAQVVLRTLALEPGHASHAARYEAAMRARNKLLSEPDDADPSWLAALEAGMAEHGSALGEARRVRGGSQRGSGGDHNDVLLGLDVVVVACDDQGNVDLDDLRAKADDDVACLMLTNPNTLGIFDPNIEEIAKIVHGVGATLYYDGANLNAVMGLSRPGDMGFDIVHFNLHKSFTQPHGGGGPGVGPVGVRAHLAPYLPNHPLAADCAWLLPIGPSSVGPPVAEVWHSSWAQVPTWGAPLAWWLLTPDTVPIGGSDFHQPGDDGLPGSPTTWVLAEGGDAARLSRSIPMAKMRDDAMIAWAQNGEPVRMPNGYPARLLLPGYEGNMCIKWIRRLEPDDLLQLGDGAAVRGFMAMPGFRFYRQDFNMDPLPCWQHTDAPDRQGVTEMKYIEGLYAYWDRIASTWPDGLREECAGGGHRLR